MSLKNKFIIKAAECDQSGDEETRKKIMAPPKMENIHHSLSKKDEILRPEHDSKGTWIGGIEFLDLSWLGVRKGRCESYRMRGRSLGGWGTCIKNRGPSTWLQFPLKNKTRPRKIHPCRRRSDFSLVLDCCPKL